MSVDTSSVFTCESRLAPRAVRSKNRIRTKAESFIVEVSLAMVRASPAKSFTTEARRTQRLIGKNPNPPQRHRGTEKKEQRRKFTGEC